MRIKFILGIVIAVLVGFNSICIAQAAEEKVSAELKAAIQKYKDGNVVGSMSDLKKYIRDNTDSATAWYYLGNCFMKLAMEKEANNAFKKVADINTVPQFTSYAIQAQLCMKDKQKKCTYKNYTYDEIQQLREDPKKFLADYGKPKAIEEFPPINLPAYEEPKFEEISFDKGNQEETTQNNDNEKNKKVVDPAVLEINKLISGKYKNNIHPDAYNFIRQENLKIEGQKMN